MVKSIIERTKKENTEPQLIVTPESDVLLYDVKDGVVTVVHVGAAWLNLRIGQVLDVSELESFTTFYGTVTLSS